MDAMRAFKKRNDALLFHGTHNVNAESIKVDGLKSFYSGGRNGNKPMMGKGIYLAPDPRKALNRRYCGETDIRTVFLCRCNLKIPAIKHENKLRCERVVLWELEVANCHDF